MEAIGRRRWAMGDGRFRRDIFPPKARIPIASWSRTRLPASSMPANVTPTWPLPFFFADREPVGPYRVTVAGGRTLHLRFNDLDDPQPIPRGTDYASVFESDVPIIVQHTRLDSRRAEVALLSTVAYAQE